MTVRAQVSTAWINNAEQDQLAQRCSLYDLHRTRQGRVGSTDTSGFPAVPSNTQCGLGLLTPGLGLLTTGLELLTPGSDCPSGDFPKQPVKRLWHNAEK